VIRLALLGAHIKHSKSPDMFAAAFAAQQIAGSYTRWPHDGDVADVFVRARQQLDGLQITAPYKAAAWHYAQQQHATIDDAAAMTQVCNVLAFRDGGIHAMNTDVAGLLHAWTQARAPRGDWVLIGAGGAAVATVVAAQRYGVVSLRVVARPAGNEDARQRRHHLVDVAARCGMPLVVDEGAAPASARVVVVGATDIHITGEVLQAAAPDVEWLHDLRYGPPAQSSADAAHAMGLRFEDGRSMLLGQAAAAFACLTGTELLPHGRAEMSAALADTR
jgi:shikimate dehydrogenase